MNNKLLLGALVILGALIGWYVFQQRGTTYGAGADAFAIKNTDKIEKIFLADRDGNTATLTRNGGEWRYEGKYKVRKAAIDNLLETVRKMEVLMLPAEAAEPLLLQDIATNGILARFYDANGKKIMGYQIGGSSPDGQGTNILMEGQKQPYIVHIPIWEGHLTPRYLIAEEDWRDRAVFAIEDYTDVASVSVEYPNYKSESFELKKVGEGYEVKPLFATTPAIDQPVKKGVVQQYLIGFRRLDAEAIRNGMEQQAGITQQLPFAVVKVALTDGTAREVRFYPIAETFGDPMAPVGPESAPIEKYFATSGEDFLLVQHVVFGKIFWAYESFFAS